jgi:hypothetical protein
MILNNPDVKALDIKQDPSTGEITLFVPQINSRTTWQNAVRSGLIGPHLGGNSKRAQAAQRSQARQQQAAQARQQAQAPKPTTTGNYAQPTSDDVAAYRAALYNRQVHSSVKRGITAAFEKRFGPGSAARHLGQAPWE